MAEGHYFTAEGYFTSTFLPIIASCVLFMSVVVFPEHQKQGISTTIIKDIQTGKLGLVFNGIQVSIDEKNIASIKLFENCRKMSWPNQLLRG